MAHLTSWQADIVKRQFSRFPFMFDWPGRLGERKDSYRQSNNGARAKRRMGNDDA